METLLPGLVAAPNAHPLFVHFPIALWSAAALFWAFGTVRRDAGACRAGLALLTLGTVAAVGALGSGLAATERMGHDAPGHDLVHVHRNYMYAASALALATTLAAFAVRKATGSAMRWTILALLIALAAVTTLGADRGALLVFGHGVGVAPSVASRASETEAAPAHRHRHGREDAGGHGGGPDGVRSDAHVHEH